MEQNAKFPKQPPRLLPDWTAKEREVWAAAKGLPQGMLIIYTHEMARIQTQVIRAGTAVKMAHERIAELEIENKDLRKKLADALRMLERRGDDGDPIG